MLISFLPIFPFPFGSNNNFRYRDKSELFFMKAREREITNVCYSKHLNVMKKIPTLLSALHCNQIKNKLSLEFLKTSKTKFLTKLIEFQNIFIFHLTELRYKYFKVIFF
ncbi:hypothetical protein PYW07_004953 [Mythimna separata]|uniref:Uncharacterized protein n=1 Tax=Mythimna separata TaxID=271217 RepID=A0AAD7YDY2_MYTSE|nr:hypothetical protein PYW07_004953 [Mythimna separata]